jgi:phenylpropionate dioxygenase-like ring-hydroxylating dioxygenase large terminal subunit
MTIDVRLLIKPDRVHGRLYSDPNLFEREFEEIWYKVWVYIGHESEVPNAGDFVRRQIGRQNVLMIRGSDGKIRVVMNRCRHRGNLLCHRERGTERTIRCTYHGWTYSVNGELLAPTFDEAYDEGINASDFGLEAAARQDSYRGLVFASLSSTGPSLLEHLGSSVEFLDLIFDRSPVGAIELSSGMQKTRYRGNWKMLPENSLEGAYHGHFIHKFAFDMFDARSGRTDRMVPHEGAVHYLPGGHMVEDFRMADFSPAHKTAAQVNYQAQLEAAYGAARADELRPGRAPILFVFPNLMYVQTHFRRLHPVSVDETHVYYQPAFLKGADPEINALILRAHETSFGPAGFLSPDDVEVMERNQVALNGKDEGWLFIGRGLHREDVASDGTTRGTTMDENHLRGMWRFYASLMSSVAAGEGRS